MISLLKNWKGNIEINGHKYSSPDAALVKGKRLKGDVHIVLYPEQQKRTSGKVATLPLKYRVKVKSYMTKPATPEFDFMKKWNNDIPMPMTVMYGDKEKETRGMVYMKLQSKENKDVTWEGWIIKSAILEETEV